MRAEGEKRNTFFISQFWSDIKINIPEWIFFFFFFRFYTRVFPPCIGINFHPCNVDTLGVYLGSRRQLSRTVNPVLNGIFFSLYTLLFLLLPLVFFPLFLYNFKHLSFILGILAEGRVCFSSLICLHFIIRSSFFFPSSQIFLSLNNKVYTYRGFFSYNFFCFVK